LIEKRFESTQKPATCPHCGSSRVADILYGYPAFSEALEQDLAAGRITLGGCCVSDDDPVWRCTACRTDIYEKR